jgi:hypothetical protein
MPTAGRRDLRFNTLDQVMPDVDRLLAGYEALGNWSLGQVCSHLARTVVDSVEGFPGRLPWVIRATFGRWTRNRILTSETIPEGVWLPEAARPKPNLDDRAEAEALRAAFRLFSARSGPTADHPLIGPMTHAQWDHLHRVHCAHHLSFLLPAPPAG